jgi:hypothetical protein
MKTAGNSRKTDTFLVPDHSVFNLCFRRRPYLGLASPADEFSPRRSMDTPAAAGSSVNGRRVVFQAVIYSPGQNASIVGFYEFRVLVYEVAVRVEITLVVTVGLQQRIGNADRGV